MKTSQRRCMLADAKCNITEREVDGASTDFKQCEADFPSTESQTAARKVVEVFREEERPAASEQAGLRTIQVGDVEQKNASGPKQFRRVAQEIQRERHVFENVPKRNNVEGGGRERRLLKRHWKDFTFTAEEPGRLFGEEAGGLNPDNLPARVRTCFQETARCASYVQDAAWRGSVRGEYPQVTLRRAYPSWRLGFVDTHVQVTIEAVQLLLCRPELSKAECATAAT